MKSLAVSGICLSLMLFACSGPSGSGLAPLDAEAVDACIEALALTQCGDGLMHSAVFSGSGAIKNIVQFKGSKLIVRAKALNEADQLNGVEWEGTILLQGGARRIYALDNDRTTSRSEVRAWQDWEPVRSNVSPRPRKGQGEDLRKILSSSSMPKRFRPLSLR